jgi:hypothetical protein
LGHGPSVRSTIGECVLLGLGNSEIRAVTNND